MGKHTLRQDSGKTLRGAERPPGSGRGWMTPEDVTAAEEAIAAVNRQNVLDAAADIAARRHYGG